MLNRRPRAVLGCLAALALTLAGGAVQAKSDLVIGVSQFPSNLNPDIDPETIKSYILGFATRSITAFDAEWQNICMLCTQVPTLANGLVKFEDRPGGRGMAVTVKLRPGLTWGDGHPLTTADLAFTAKVGRDPQSGVANAESWTRVENVEVIDAQTAVLHMRTIDTQYDRLPGLLPEHIEGPVYARATGPGEYGKQSVYNRAPTTPGLYNGPYLITDYDSGGTVTLQPNPNWQGKKPYFERIVVKTIGNTAALQANLLSGDIDMAPGDAPSLTIDQVIQLRKQQPDAFTYIFRPALTYEHIDFNLDNPLLQDVRVRRALLYAADRKTLVDRLFEGHQPVADSFVNPQDPMFAKDMPRYAYDPARARALLAEAGWTPGDDGICRNAAGQRLSFVFQTTAGNRLRELQQQVLQSQWKQACIEATIKNEPARTFFGETLKQRLFTGMAMYAWTSSISYPPEQSYASSAVPTAANSFGGSNYMGWRNKDVDAAIAVTRTDLDVVHQRDAWATLQRLYAEELPALPLFFRAEAYVLPKWLKGVTPTGHTDLTSEWSEGWTTE
jgi:peptide/nickel transport system substrate-binding protein